jgi:hypothetical protein
MPDRIRRNLGARPRKKREPAVRYSGGMALGFGRRGVCLLRSMRIDFWKGYVLMINRGHSSTCGSAPCEGPVSTGKCFAIDPGKKSARNHFRRGAPRPLLFLLALSLATAGCGLTGSKAGEGQTTPTVSISLMQTPPSSMSVGTTTSVSATVNNDVANAGVDWVSTCGTPRFCGSFSPPHTDSGAATTFMAPIGVPTGNTVSVTALSATDHSKASAASVTIISTVTGVTITQFPPASYPAGGTFNVAANVAGDPSNFGVDWKATCGTVDCTSGFTGGPHSAPLAPAAFTVPVQSVAFPTLIGSTVTLTAFATADHRFSASTSFTVAASISINVTQAPPTTVLTNASAPVIAVVTNDPTNSGVTWTIENCDLAPCGSWSATSNVLTTSVASGATVTYFAPPTAVNHVNIQAAATASPTTVVANFQLDVLAPISIAITEGLLNKTIVANVSAPLVATVSHDIAGGLVDWTVTCGSAGACGSFSPTQTASGAPTTFTAPTSVPTGNSVTITATSTTDPTKTASETDTVTASIPPNSLFKNGQWIMLLRGRDQNGGPYSLGGEVASDGAGNITGGNFDFEDLGSGGAGPFNGMNVGLVASTYSIGTDGRGQITLTGNPNTVSNLNGSFGVNGSITLSVVFVNNSHALLSETDAFGSATGTLDSQNSGDLTSFQNGTSGFSGTYSISLAGAETASPNPEFFVEGALSLTSSGSTNAESAYIADQSDKGAITSIGLTSNSNLGFSTNSVPGANGEISLGSIQLGLHAITKLNAWLIDAKHFVVTDTDSIFFGTPAVIVSGYLVAQPSSTGLSGTYAFAEAGESASPGFVPQAVGGFVTCDPTSSTGPTGTLDVTPLGGTPASINTIHALCSTGSRGRGLITMSGAGTTGISKFVEYPTVDQGLFLMELDGGATGTSGPSGAGVARQQTLSAPIAVTNFTSKYASNFLATTSQGSEAFAGQIISDGTSTLSGTVDVNSFNNSTPPFGAGTASSNAVLSGSFTAGTSGRFPLALTITPATGQPTPEFTTLDPACYIVDPNTCLLLGLDATAPGTGILELQNTGL